MPKGRALCALALRVRVSARMKLFEVGTLDRNLCACVRDLTSAQVGQRRQSLKLVARPPECRSESRGSCL